MDEERWLVERGLDTLDDVFYIYDSDGQLTYWNAALSELFGLTAAELSGMQPPDFFVETDKPRVEQAVREVFENERTLVEARAETEKGRIRFELTGQRMTDDEGELLGFCGIGRDVTRVREREWQLERHNKRLSEFSEILTHDIRNPLQVAMTHLEIERSKSDSESLEKTDLALQRIRNIIDDVLTIAREGQAVTDPTQVALDAVARAAWESVDTAEAELDVETTATVAGDQGRLQRLFENVFRNALEHGGRDVTVTVTDTETGFAITDDGPGIPESIRADVFEAGVSGSSSGTGFGLSIVRNLAEAHGWSVDAVASDTGARFEFDVRALRDDGGTVQLEGVPERDERGE